MRKSKTMVGFLTNLILVITTFVISIGVYINGNFENQNLDEMIYYLFNGLEGTSIDVLTSAIQTSIIPFMFTLFLLYLPILRPNKRKHSIELVYRKKKIAFSIFPIKTLYKFRFLYALGMFLLSLILCFYLLGIREYLYRLNDYSTIFEEYYVSGKDIAITFPNEKRNLIILYLESLENTMISEENGGGWKYTVIPELENLAAQNINYSNTKQIGGALPITGTGWTVAGLVATTSGIPLKIPIHGNDYTSSDNFLAGAYTLGDVLEKEGYHLEFMVGSEAGFGGRSNYYTKHGNYEIFDVKTAIEEGKMLDTERAGWGFDDSHLFTWAEEEITELARQKEPFSFSFLTVNTHFPDGYLESAADNNYESQYENVHAYSSKQVDEFVNWLKDQDFYDNTTLVILGDHLSMQDPVFYHSHLKSGYIRTIYNAIVNSPVEPIQPTNRNFTSLDMYPTILASLGVEIEGNRLGLGTNLFSTKETLVEELGYDYFNKELTKNSNFYNRNILQGDYLDMLNQSQVVDE